LEGKDVLLVSLQGRNGTAKHWVDRRSYLPLQAEFSDEMDGNTHLERYKVLKLEVNPSLPKDIFVFRPPQGAREIAR